MLIEFEVGNYLSFKAAMRLSMVAANPYKEYLEENTFETAYDGLRLLKSAAIYGANASGKSNLVAAMGFMRNFVLSSSKDTQAEDPISVKPFLLDTATENAPSHFEVFIMQDGIRYRYGFEADRKAIRKEWLMRTEKNKETPLFLREDDGIEVCNPFKEGLGLEEKTRDNALFLSVVAQFNGEISRRILKWFSDFQTIHGLIDQIFEPHAVESLQDPTKHEQLLKFMRNADFGISELRVAEVPNTPNEKILKMFSPEFQKTFQNQTSFEISALHQKFQDGAPESFVPFDFNKMESEGTKKFLRIAAPLLDCLSKGYVVAVDELDAKLHPLLTKAIVGLFNSSVTNPKGAQLIFVTHDTNLLEHGKLRRDQIWFTEKDRLATTVLYSLAEFKLPDGNKVRKDANLETNYIHGRYGAIPYLGNFETLLKETDHGKTD
jgi:AAA15 family ATPase/GTPase